MIMYGLSPICFYISLGPDSSAAEDIAFWANYLSSQNSDVGSSGSRSYLPERSARSGNNVDGVTKVGPAVRKYDPELAMIFGTEF